MTLFNKIYESANLFRLQEARILDTPQKVIDAINDEYIIRLLNGKKFLPEWIKVLVKEDSPKLGEFYRLLEKVLNAISNIPNGAINETLCLLIKKSIDLDTMYNIVYDSLDTLSYFCRTAKSQWIHNLDSYDEVMEYDYNQDTWHSFEKEMQDALTLRKSTKNKRSLTPSEKEALYNTLYEDDSWGLYTPKSFEGDSVLSSDMEPFESDGKTYNKTRWCTAADKSYYDNYTNNGRNKLYVIKYFEDGLYTEAWQVAFSFEEEVCFMDKEDNENYDFVFESAPDELLSKITFDRKNLDISLLDFKQLIWQFNKNIELSSFFNDNIKDVESYKQSVSKFLDLVRDDDEEEVERACELATQENAKEVYNNISVILNKVPGMDTLPIGILNGLATKNYSKLIEEYRIVFTDLINCIDSHLLDIPRILQKVNPKYQAHNYVEADTSYSLEDLLKEMKLSEEDYIDYYLVLEKNEKILPKKASSFEYSIKEDFGDVVMCKKLFPESFDFYINNSKSIFGKTKTNNSVDITLLDFCLLSKSGNSKEYISLFKRYINKDTEDCGVSLNDFLWKFDFRENADGKMELSRLYKSFLEGYQEGLYPVVNQELLDILGADKQRHWGLEMSSRFDNIEFFILDCIMEYPNLAKFLKVCQDEELLTKPLDPPLVFLLSEDVLSRITYEEILNFLRARKEGKLPAKMTCKDLVTQPNWVKEYIH